MSRCVELRRARPLLGTFVEIRAEAESESQAQVGVTRAFVAVARVQAEMSFHDETSELSRMNRDAFRKPVRVHDWTWQVLAKAQEYALMSGGAFDVTIAPLLCRWGFLPAGSVADTEATFRNIVLGPEYMVRFMRPLAIDLGGIAKGFAVDRAVEALQAAGCTSGAVNAGGDLRMFGEEPQEVHLRDPVNPGRPIGVVSLQNRALATSGVYFSRKVHAGMTVSPLIDGKTRTPLVDNLSAAVSAPDCVAADALTKIVLALGERSCEILRSCGADAVLLQRGSEPQILSS